MQLKTITTEVINHNTREDYVLIENSENHRAEIHCHGYDGEDCHLYEMVKELKFENPSFMYSLQFIRQVNV